MIQNITLGNISVEIELPDICPSCVLGITPRLLTYHLASERSYLGVIFECPICKTIGFANFVLFTEETSAWVADLKGNNDKVFSRRIAVYPKTVQPPAIPETIKNYYPEFYEIYNQAHIAEQNNLHKIIGMAYRKSLENLVKNYLIETFPNEQENILKESLGRSIARISYPKIQSLARAASWIGNDETHMVKKNSDWKVKDMKDFILALCHLILAEKVVDSATNMLTAGSN